MTREEKIERREKTRREKKQDKRRDKMKREDEREKGRQDEEKMKGKMNEKRRKRCFFFEKNVSRPSNPPDELAQNVSKKNHRRMNRSSIFLQKFRIWPFFHLFT